MRLGQGREGARYFLKDNPDVVEQVKKAVLHKTGYAWLLGEDESGHFVGERHRGKGKRAAGLLEHPVVEAVGAADEERDAGRPVKHPAPELVGEALKRAIFGADQAAVDARDAAERAVEAAEGAVDAADAAESALEDDKAER